MKYAQDDFSLDQKYRIDPATGFLHIPVIPAKEGILEYNAQGKMERRFLPASVIKAALDSFNYIPVTQNHEGGLVSKGNIKKVGRGFLKGNATFDGLKARNEAVIQDEELINNIVTKHMKEASSGYKYDDDGKPGDNQYGIFDTSYTWIEGNHISAVYRGRAGADVKFEIDQKEKVKMGKIKQPLPVFKIGDDQLLGQTTIMFEESDQSAFDACSDREQKLIDKVQSQNTEIQTLKASNAANKESLDAMKTAQDGLIKKEDLNSLTAELLDARQVSEKIGLDCKTEIDPLTIKQKVLEKMLPVAYKDLKERDSLKNKSAVDAAYGAFKENMGFHQEVHNTQRALEGGQGAPVQTPQPRLLKSFAQFPR